MKISNHLWLGCWVLFCAGISAQSITTPDGKSQLSFGPEAFAPPGAEWCYRIYGAADKTLGYVMAHFDRDTVIEGRGMKVIRMDSRTVVPNLDLWYYNGREEIYWQRNDSVFYHQREGRGDLFLFKQTYQTGEQTTTGLFPETFDVMDVRDVWFTDRYLTAATIDLFYHERESFPARLYGFIGPDRGFLAHWQSAYRKWGGEDLEAYRDDKYGTVYVQDHQGCFAFFDRPPADRVTIARGEEISVFPNPWSGNEALRMRWSGTPTETELNVKAELYSAEGRRHWTGKLQLSAGEATEIPLRHPSPGVYLLRFIRDEKQWVFRVVID